MPASPRILTVQDMSPMMPLGARIKACEQAAAEMASMGSLVSRVTAIESGMPAINSTLTSHTSSIAGLISAIYDQVTRLATLEAWRADKAPKISKLNMQNGLIGVSILGLNIQVASRDSVKTIADKLDEVIGTLQTREITAP